MRIGDLLIRAGLVTNEGVARAMELGKANGARLGDNLVAMGLIERTALERFIHRIPREPADLKATRIDENDLLSLLIKLIFVNRLNSVGEYIHAIKLPLIIVTELATMAVDRRLLSALGSRTSDSLLDMSYSLTEEGRRFAVEALANSAYVGPAPVTIDEFCAQVTLQRPTNERISINSLREGMGELTVDISLLERAGPALNSGRAILLYGPPGNGKTTVALSFANVFREIIYVPYAIIVEGQIIRFFDPAVHVPLDPAEGAVEENHSFTRSETFDTRWVATPRPFVIVGGELTLDMLDLRYSETGHFYEAPMHMKALCGCFFIDDFGRQLVSPTALLNRWIVPLESRIDFLKLHTGKSFSIPFEETVIFSTNLEPEDLMDPAFLRRLPYKIEVGAPSLDRYREIFELESARQGLKMHDELFHFIVRKVRDDKGLELAAYQPRFIVDQVVATCRFLGESPYYNPRYVEYAINNLRVNTSEAANGKLTSAQI
jgi:DNA polymerase III delta prime subunit